MNHSFKFGGHVLVPDQVTFVGAVIDCDDHATVPVVVSGALVYARFDEGDHVYKAERARMELLEELGWS